MVQVVQIGGRGGGAEGIWTKSKKTSTFFCETFPKIKKHKLIYLQRESSVHPTTPLNDELAEGLKI